MNKTRRLVSGLLLALFTHWVFADTSDDHAGDPHYTAAGFFDLHVCNWPQRGIFLMAVFSTELFDQLDSVDIYTPNQVPVGSMSWGNFREFKTKSGKLKRAFISYFDLPAKQEDGWYQARIKLKDGTQLLAKDYLVTETMPYPVNLVPPPDTYEIPAPKTLSWDKMVGAKYYKVTVRDKLDNHVVFASELTEQNQVAVPSGALEAGKLYGWKVHARDGKESTLLGDFNHGSLSQEAVFSVY